MTITSLMAIERTLGQSALKLIFSPVLLVFWVLSEHVNKQRRSKFGFTVERKIPPGKTFCFTAGVSKFFQ